MWIIHLFKFLAYALESFAIIFLKSTEVFIMRFILSLTLVFSLFLSGCYSSSKRNQKELEEPNDKFTTSGICFMRSKEGKWRRQSVEEMRVSRKIPSVDFEFDSIVLRPSAYPVLDKVAKVMTDDRSMKLIIEGHTDEIGTHEYNDWLSSARAMAIKSYLVSRDVYADSITTYGYGKRMPLVRADTSPEGRACNRRVVFVMTDRHWSTVF